MQRDALRLLAITDNLHDGIDGLTRRARASCRGGATMIQLRLPNEEARTLSAVARALVAGVEVPIIVHGRLDIAIAAGAAGVHLGIRDVTVPDARRVGGDSFIVGRSAGSAEDLARAEGADYIALGPVFPTDQRGAGNVLGIAEFERLTRSTTIPVVAVGGITPATSIDAVRAGAAGIALISGIFGARDPERAAREVRSAIER